MTSWPGHAVLQVGVPELENWVRERTRHYDPGFVSADPRFTHAHITVLAPLLTWDLAAITRLAAATKGFDYELRHIKVFPNGIIYLRPEPDEQFRRLTQLALVAHPNVKPNGAPDPKPHLTLDLNTAEIDVASTRRSLGDLIPVTSRAETLELSWYRSGECHLIERWPLMGG